MPNSTFTSIEVNDFGPIRRGKIELRPLTVFTGVSNTGKSCLATLVYALAQHSVKFQRRGYIYSEELYDKIEDTNIAERTIDFKPIVADSKNRIPLEGTLAKFLDHSSSIHKKDLEIEIARTFGFQKIKQAISWKSNNDARIIVTSPSNGLSKTPSSMSINIGRKHFGYETENPEYLDIGKLNELESLRFERLQRFDQEHRRAVNLQMARFVYRVLNRRFFNANTVIYLPAGRVGLMDSFRTIVGSSIQSELDNVTIGQFQSRPLSGVLVDFLQLLTSITPTRDKRTRNGPAYRLEEELLHGSIEVVLNQLNFPYFFYKPLDTEKLLPLNLSSSMISQLAPIVLFLKVIPRKNNIIVLEEPEAHLHPMQQVRFLQEISKWTREGNKIIVTTHSEWVTEALSNLVIENKIDPKVGMKAKDIGLWQFIEGKKGTEIKESVWNVADGGFDDGFEEVGDQFLNEWTWYKGELL